MKIKKLLAGALSAFIVSVFPSAAVFADDLEGPEDVLSDGAFEYEIKDGGYIITKCTASIITKIPDIQNGVPVVAIGDEAFAGCSGISELTIPETVKTIGNNAFVSCTSLKKLTLPAGLESLGENAFAGCSMLESVEIPETLTVIPGGAFRQCDHLTSLKIPDNVTSFGSYAFYQCTSLEELTLPDSLTEIGDMALGDLLSLQTIDADGCGAFVFEDDILTDKDKTAAYCGTNRITELNIPDTVTEVKPGAFSASSSAVTVRIPSSVKKIGYGAFSSQLCANYGYVTQLSNIEFSEGLESIGEGAFGYSSIEKLLLPASLKEIGTSAFEGCYKLSRVVIPEGVKSIGSSAFLRCEALKNVNIPKSVEEIGDTAFGYSLYGDGVIKVDGFKIGAASGSAAAKYAKKNDIEYDITDKSLKRMVFIIIAVGLVAAVIVFAVVLMSRSRKTAGIGAKKAKKKAQEKAAEDNYKKIVDD